MMKTSAKWLASLATGLACTLASLSTNLEATFASIKAHGMGQTGVANPLDTLSTVYNPANAAHLCNRWDLGVHVPYWSKQFTIDGSSNAADNRTFHGGRGIFALPEFGYNYWYNPCWVLGLTLSPHEFIKTNHKLPIVTFGGSGASNARFDYHVARLSFFVAHRFNRCHTFGASLDVYAGRLKIDGFEAFNTTGSTPGTNTLFPGRVTGKGYDYTSGLGFTIGWIGRLYPCLDVGVSYTHEVHTDQFDRYKGFLPQGKINIPSIFRAGFAYEFMCDWKVAFDYEYRYYGRIHSLDNTFPGTDAAGGRHGFGFGWKNQSIYKVGLQYDWDNCLALRFGYRYEKAPMRSNSDGTVLNGVIVKTAEHILSTGFTWNWDYCTELSFYFEHGFANKIYGSLPEGDGEGSGGGSTTFREKYYGWGLALGRRF